MKNVYLVEGILIDECTVKLNEKVPVQNGRVSVMVEAVEESEPKRSLAETIAYIQREQEKSYFVASTRKEVDARLAEERASWD